MPTKKPPRLPVKAPIKKPVARAAAKPVPAAARQSSPAKPVATSKPKPRVVIPPPSAKSGPKPAPGKVAPLPVKPTVNGTPKATNGSLKPALPGKPASAAKPPLPIVKAATPADKLIPAEKDLSTKNKTGTIKDRIVLMVPDPFWVHAYWELSLASVQRAEAALGQDWHGAKPIIRLFDVTSQDTTSTSEAPLRDIHVHGGCSHWYIDVPQPPRTYRADIGYLSKRGQFYVLARSNVVTPPKAGASETVEPAGNLSAEVQAAGGVDRVLAMSTGFENSGGPSQLREMLEEQFRRPMKDGSFGPGAAPGKLKKFHFDLDAELIVFGRTDPTATVTLQNEPVKLRADGSFTMRFSLPDSRQIIPAIATSADGLEEQTIVLAVERNIKRLDPMTHDMYGES